MITEFAPAKINLYLHVTGKRPDGYHLLDSLVVFAEIGDTIRVAAAPRFQLTIDGPEGAGLAVDDGNIIIRAAHALAAAAKIETGAAIHLTKRLPVASGIGGGSTDAAATLRALGHLWQVRLGADHRHAVALGLGADVPVCLTAEPARMSGIGETLAPVPPVPPAWLVLVNPRLPLSTPAVFQARKACYSDPAPLETTPRDAAHLARLLAARRNDLTDAACSLVPEISEILGKLADCESCLLARMSGSGATCFGLFADQMTAQQAADKLRASCPQWWVESARLRA